MKTEKNIITKAKFFFDIDKEFDYINEMNKKGWKLLYNKWGIFMTFEKTKPDEYFTIMHTESKKNIAKVTAFAAQCGYESIPHTMDGFGEVLYLTGKKSGVSDEFVSGANEKINVYKRLNKKLFSFIITYIIIDLLFVAETACYIGAAINTDYDSFLLKLSVFTGAFALLFIGFTFKLASMFRRYRKKIKQIKQDSMIFE